MVLCLFIFPVTGAADVATVHGAVYDWETFKLLENTIVEVNSTPPQSQLAKYGLYSFDLPIGIYLLKASYYKNGELVSYREETLNITDNGDYLLDILLLPAYPKGNLNQSDLPEIPTLIKEEDLIQNENYKSTIFLIVSGSLLIAGAIVFLILKKKQSSHSAHLETSLYVTDHSGPENAIDDEVSLPQDLQQVIDIIKADGGKITQRDLRRKLSYSEAKVSLMVSDLENRGIIEKIKKGRGNIIVLKQRNHQNI
ncbi:MAG: winged helix-turn-helix transcriptional regulator [Methanomethylovorans sp.]|uniref:helix-turn-helix transcriptional regulator n=1 Tax=Methanomethylovorans sp. TaxID=2758717 RepID=UPI00345E6CEF